MNNTYITLANQQNLIDGVIMRKLIVHKDESGILVETLRADWLDVLTPDMPFAMQYMSVTPPGIARDEDKWHLHKFQDDRFICVSGRIVTAIFDPRENSKTKNVLNLFLMGPDKEEEMYLVVIPKETYHGFMVVSETPGYLLNIPTQLYNASDENRVENTQFDWHTAKEDFHLK